MSQHNRLSSYVQEPQETISNAFVSMEAEGGVFGIISNGIKMLTKGFKASENSPDPHNMTDPDGKRIWSSEWLENSLKALPQTWSNPGWVSDNLNSRDVQAAKIASALSYKGKVPSTPVEAMKNAEKVANEVFAKYTSPIQQYANQIRDIEKQAAGWLKETKSPEETAARMIAAIRKLKSPIPPGFVGPEMLGGNRYSVSTSGATYDVSPRDNYRADGSRLRALTVDQIVEASKLLEEHIVAVKESWKKMIAVGSGCDSGVWDSLDYDASHGEELWDLFYFQAEPDAVESTLSEPLFIWLEALLDSAKWIHSQVSTRKVSLESLQLLGKNHISLESANPRLAQYFDDTSKAANSDQRAALFGTVQSNWRVPLIELLNCEVFNPVVTDWNKEAQAQEELLKKTASALVFCITPKQTGFYSFVEITNAAIRTPDRLFVCFLDDDEGTAWDEKQKASVDATRTYLKNECGITVYDTLEALAEAINAEVEPISENGSLKSTDNSPTETPQGGL